MSADNKIDGGTYALPEIVVTPVDYGFLTDRLLSAAGDDRKLTITYAALHSVNLAAGNSAAADLYRRFDIVHPDGIAVYLALRFLYGSREVFKRFTGSDWYEYLIPVLKKNSIPVFFFGDSRQTLQSIMNMHPDMNIAGVHDGFEYTESLPEKINRSGAKILFAGLGSPKQEKWIMENRTKINTPVIIAVGEGLRVFGGTKQRGGKFIQKIGLEWLVRLISEPFRLWKRYIIGVPVFIYRIMLLKLSL